MQCAVLILALAMTNTPKTEPRYVPRSKRTWAGRMMKRGWAMMTAWIEETLDYVADRCSTTTSRTKAARRIAMGMQGQRGKWKRRIPAAIAMAAIAMPATNAFGEPIRLNAIQFDTDSGRVGVDNRCSACISHKIGDFAGPIHDVRRAIKGFGGKTTHNVKMGTLDWSWCDNQGKVHRFRIPNSYYVPKAASDYCHPSIGPRLKAACAKVLVKPPLRTSAHSFGTSGKATWTSRSGNLTMWQLSAWRRGFRTLNCSAKRLVLTMRNPYANPSLSTPISSATAKKMKTSSPQLAPNQRPHGNQLPGCHLDLDLSRMRNYLCQHRCTST